MTDPIPNNAPPALTEEQRAAMQQVEIWLKANGRFVVARQNMPYGVPLLMIERTDDSDKHEEARA